MDVEFFFQLENEESISVSVQRSLNISTVVSSHSVLNFCSFFECFKIKFYPDLKKLLLQTTRTQWSFVQSVFITHEAKNQCRKSLQNMFLLHIRL